MSGNSLAATISVVVLAAALSLNADSLKADTRSSAGVTPDRFFKTHGAITPFDDDIVGKQPKAFRFLPYQPNPQTGPVRPDQPIARYPEQPKHPKEPEAPEVEVSMRDQIVSEFGDPDVSEPVLAKSDAPAPFGGLMRALQEGEEELAYQYARKWVRYLRDLQERVQQVSTMTGLAMVREGVKPVSPFTNSPLHEDYKKYYDADVEAMEAMESLETAPTDSAEMSLLKDAAREIIEKVKAEEAAEVAPAEEPSESSVNEEQARKAWRASLLGRVPVDPQKKVDVFFFFRPQEAKSLAMAPEIESLYAAFKDNPNVHVIGFTVEDENAGVMRNFRQTTRTTFPIKRGRLYTQMFGVKEVPFTVFVATSTGESWAEHGARQLYQLEEVLSLMQGGN